MDSSIATVPLRWMRGSLIGAGSFGKVHLALNLDSGEMFAVKSIKGKAEELEKEVGILQTLQESPNVVRCMGSLDFEGSKMMCMEYMPGGTLTDLMKRFGGKLEESLVRVYCRQILEGMEYFHRKGIVHCDIKASNVLVGSKGEVKIADFGSAKTIAISAEEGEKESVKGSPMWMAPEVIREEDQGPASDVWSLGCTLLELLTGRPPWTSSSSSTSNPMHALFTIASSSSSASQLLQHYYFSSSSSSSHHSLDLSEEGKDFLLCCLQMDPKARWTASQLLMHPFLANPTHFRYKEKELLIPPSSPISTLDFHAQYWENFHTSTSSSSSSTLIPPPQSSSLATPSDHSMHITTTDDDLIRQHRFSLDDAQDTKTTASSSSSSSSSSQNSSHPPNGIESLPAEEADEDWSSSCRSSSSCVIIDDNQQWIVVHKSPSSPPLKPLSDLMSPSSSSPSLCLQQQRKEEEEGRGGGQALVVKKACNVDLDCFGFLINRRRPQG